jgi:hypothetical protein
MLVAMIFGLEPSWGMLLVPLIAALAGFGWAAFGLFIAAKSEKIESFSYWQSGLLTPMFLVAGTFFPLDGLPQWAQFLGHINPLYHCVELVRHAVFGFEGWIDVWHVSFLVGFVAHYLRGETWRVYHIIIGFFLLIANVLFLYLASRVLDPNRQWGSEISKYETAYANEHETFKKLTGELDGRGEDAVTHVEEDLRLVLLRQVVKRRPELELQVLAGQRFRHLIPREGVVLHHQLEHAVT